MEFFHVLENSIPKKEIQHSLDYLPFAFSPTFVPWQTSLADIEMADIGCKTRYYNKSFETIIFVFGRNSSIPKERSSNPSIIRQYFKSAVISRFSANSCEVLFIESAATVFSQTPFWHHFVILKDKKLY